jgi:anhydro-N-acetylmuramic acid kinase
MRVAGVMSGTSLDGIDVAIVEIGKKIQTIGFQSAAYPERVRSAILAVSGGQIDPKRDVHPTGALSALNFQLGELYARAVLRAVKSFGAVELIGCHGQTVFHEGGKHTLQIGEAAVIAERTGVPVVSNFRARDVAAGGQGAPLVPFVDYLLFRHPKRTRIALNIGGIANISVIPPNAQPEDVIAFDTGPGNMVIDALVSEYSNGKLRFDRGGKIARSGKVNEALLAKLLRDRYYKQKWPKSVGREQYGSEFLARLKKTKLALPDLIATATALTASTIALGIELAAPAAPFDLIAAGGGVHNREIMSRLEPVSTSTEYGIHPDAKEAIAFAILAFQTWQKRPGNLPSATGARHPVLLGDVTF